MRYQTFQLFSSQTSVLLSKDHLNSKGMNEKFQPGINSCNKETWHVLISTHGPAKRNHVKLNEIARFL